MGIIKTMAIFVSMSPDIIYADRVDFRGEPGVIPSFVGGDRV
jgi:hypothetical protein